MLINYEKHKKIIELYKKGLSLQQVANQIGYKSPNTIKNILLKYNIEIRSKAGYKKPFNESYFEKIDSERKAYFLGYLMADGNVYKRDKSQPCIRMELNNKDIDILYELEKDLNLDNHVKYTRKNCSKIYCHSLKMFNDLSKYGIIPNKTGKEIIPNVSDELMQHFIRGFFDGDGWCTNTTSHGKNKGSRKNIGFVSNKKFLIDLQNYLHDKLGLSMVKINEKIGCGQLLYSSKKDVQTLINYMYNNSSIYLKRKYNSCMQVYVNTEVTSHND